MIRDGMRSGMTTRGKIFDVLVLRIWTAGY